MADDVLEISDEEREQIQNAGLEAMKAELAKIRTAHEKGGPQPDKDTGFWSGNFVPPQNKTYTARRRK